MLKGKKKLILIGIKSVLLLAMIFTICTSGSKDTEYIPKIKEIFTKGDKNSPTAVLEKAIAQIEGNEELVDDTELVAVITAAIAASEGTSTDSFVVRSIHRR